MRLTALAPAAFAPLGGHHPERLRAVALQRCRPLRLLHDITAGILLPCAPKLHVWIVCGALMV